MERLLLPKENGVCELSQYNDCEGGVSVVFMSNIHRRSELQIQHLRNQRTEADKIRQLLPNNGDYGHGNLRSIAHTLEIYG